MSKHTFSEKEAIEIANKVYMEHSKKYGDLKHNVITAKKSVMEADTWNIVYEYIDENGYMSPFELMIEVFGNGEAKLRI